MSADLQIFDPETAPKKESVFYDWFNEQTEWNEDHNYDDPRISSDRMQAWFYKMTKIYPAMNGPFANNNYDNPKITDYCIGRHIIQAGFALSEADGLEYGVQVAQEFNLGYIWSDGAMFPYNSEYISIGQLPENKSSFNKIKKFFLIVAVIIAMPIFLIFKLKTAIRVFRDAYKDE